MEEFMTTGEIAKILKVNILTVRRWIHAGILPAAKFLKEFRVNKKDFDKFVEFRQVKKVRELSRTKKVRIISHSKK